LALLWAFSDGPLSDRLENWPTRACVEFWRDDVGKLGGGSTRPLCLLGIGSTHRSKIWRPENFAAIIPEIEQRYSLVPVLVASSEEAVLAETILSLHPNRVLYHRGSTLEDICALSIFARLYVGNDTGPKHIAAAAGVPVVEINPFQPDDQIYQQERSANFHPHGVPHFLLHPPCDLPADAVHTGAAINAIKPEDVAAAIQNLMHSIG
jgi:ADP-heptose:LPS heptosyltransferase